MTAQKYRQRALDVPISLQVIDASELQQHGITSLADLQYDVPGLYMNDSGTTHAIYLRGVGNYLGTGAMVGQYIDEADVTAETYYSGTIGYATNDSSLYDLQRVEVLKGPQGTLYGDGSMGGVIRYITNSPNVDRFQFGSHVATLFTEDGAPSQQIEAMINAPLSTGTAALRLAGMSEHDGGWIDEPQASLKNINGGDLSDLRGEVRWHPVESLIFNFMQIVHRHTSGINDGEDSNGNISPLFSTTFVPTTSENSDLTNLTIDYDMAIARLISSSTYLEGEETTNERYSATMAPGHPTFWFLQPYQHVDNQGISEELRLVGDARGALHWSAGGLYKDYRDRDYYLGEFVGGVGSTLSSARQGPGIDERESSSSLAGFADGSYRLLRRLTVGAGFRYFKDRQTDASANLIGYLSPSAAHVRESNPAGSATFTSADPRFYVQYRVSDGINIYASASKGFRSGGFNPPPAPNYNPEVLWSYELGAKFRYPAQRLRADVDVFDMNYSNYVSDTYIAPLYFISNVGKARIQGVDADLTWLPIDQWEVTVNAEVLRSKFLAASAISGYAPGERLPFAPTYSMTESIERSLSWGSRRAELEIYYYEMSRVQYRLAGVPLFESDILRSLNFRTEFQWNESLSFGVFARNLTNDRGYESPLYYAGASARPRPRTYGIDFDVRFGQ